MTKIDEALVAAQGDRAKSSDFYNAFLNSEIFVPLIEPPNPADPGGFKLILIEAEGKKFLMIFDTPERLAAWAKRQVDFVGIPGHAVVQMMDPSIPWILNVGTDYVKEFVTEEIQWLKSAIANQGQ